MDYIAEKVCVWEAFTMAKPVSIQEALKIPEA